MKAEVKELLARQYFAGSRVVNCIPHMHIDLTERPEDCRLCLADLRNQLSLAASLNKWLNTWKDDATKVLTS